MHDHCPLPHQPLSVMAPHLTSKELESLRKWMGKGLTPLEIHKRFCAARLRRGLGGPTIQNLRKTLKGATYKMHGKETRGRKQSISPAMVKRLNVKRRTLIKQRDGAGEVTWKEIVNATPGCNSHRTTASRAFQTEGIDVRFRMPRKAMPLQRPIEQERFKICRRWQYLPMNYFVDTIDLIIDNKRWDIPTTDGARAHLQKHRLRGHMRTRQEGVESGFTKPCPRKHRINPGGWTNVCAGISNGRIVLWQYLDGPWKGAAAAELYKGPILSVLHRQRGEKSTYTILEDNDPRGYKATVARRAKAEVGIVTMDLPRYTPELMPLDFSLWAAIQAKMDEYRLTGPESPESFKKRLRSTALSLPRDVVVKALLDMKRRILAIRDAEGKRIASD